jgi:hypothetical protein
MSSHATHRQEGRKHKHHRPLQRGSVSGNLSAKRSQGLAEAIRQALEEREAERLQTTRRVNSADDDEDPTRRGGGENV